ncbi:cytochrome P450 9e2-like [Lycorma delicatula]|uniref:cytochrome P450 9e2-like n=1 Tax=Lycorma delicatula TaxID=130591 RepID=UPI003F515478
MFYCVYFFSTKDNNYWKKKGVLSLDSKCTFGVLLDTLLFRRTMADMVLDIYKQLEGEKFGGYVQFMTRVFAIRDPELINQVLIKDFTYFEDRGPPVEKSVELFSSSLNNLCGDEWRIARQKLTPMFSSGKLKMMFELIKECCSEAVLYLKDNKDDLEAKGFILRLIIKIIANAAFGLKVDVLHEEGAKTNKFFNASSKFFKPSVSLLFKFLIFVSFPKLRNLFKVKLMDDDVNQFFRNLIKDITKHRQETGTRRNDFLQIMLDQKKKEQTNLNNGITNVSFNDDEAEEPEDKELLEQLKYVDNISNNCSIPNETLRLHPILGALLRYCKKDYKIPGTDVVIEKGTMLNIPVLGLHKDPQYFPNPEKFNPDHFQNMEVIPKNVYMPFGYGPRICIAMRLAMLEMKIILVSLLSHYTIELSEKTKLPLKMFKISVFPGVDGGIWVKQIRN